MWTKWPTHCQSLRFLSSQANTFSKPQYLNNTIYCKSGSQLGVANVVACSRAAASLPSPRAPPRGTAASHNFARHSSASDRISEECSDIDERTYPVQVVGDSCPSPAASRPESSPCPAPRTGKRGPKQRMRLDAYCQLLAPHYSRNVIQSFILQGKVRVGDRVVTKAGTPVVVDGPDQVVIDADQPKYVCRAGLKLEKALSHWGIDVRGATALDSGQSTGGFTDCLLQHGVAKVYGIDVGYNQLAERIRRDERVVVMEKFNLRHLGPQHLPCKVDIATLDLSFISVLLVVGPVTSVLRPDGGKLVVLIKPQFEAGKKQVGAGGVVRDPKVHADVIARVTSGIADHGYELVGVIESPIKGDKSGNTEFLAYFIRRPELAVAASEAVTAAEAAAEVEAEVEVEVEAVGGPGTETAKGRGRWKRA